MVVVVVVVVACVVCGVLCAYVLVCVCVIQVLESRFKLGLERIGVGWGCIHVRRSRWLKLDSRPGSR